MPTNRMQKLKDYSRVQLPETSFSRIQKFKMFVQSLTILGLFAAKAAATIYYAGVAESGGEFGVYSKFNLVSH